MTRSKLQKIALRNAEILLTAAWCTEIAFFLNSLTILYLKSPILLGLCTYFRSILNAVVVRIFPNATFASVARSCGNVWFERIATVLKAVAYSPLSMQTRFHYMFISSPQEYTTEKTLQTISRDFQKIAFGDGEKTLGIPILFYTLTSSAKWIGCSVAVFSLFFCFFAKRRMGVPKFDSAWRYFFVQMSTSYHATGWKIGISRMLPS